MELAFAVSTHRPDAAPVMPSPRHLLLLAMLALAATLLGGPTEARSSRPLKLVVLGDSLSSGFLIPRAQAFPAVLEASLKRSGIDVTVVDAAVTNDPSWGGLARLDRDVPADTDGVILELGANDMIRMTSPLATRNALEQIIARLRARGIPVLLAGFRMPIPWMHDAAGFEQVYRSLARRYRLIAYPDFYAGLWAEPRYRLIDGVHPSPEGVQRIVAGILPTVRRFVGALPRSRGAGFQAARRPGRTAITARRTL
ncbi:GDSL-type esterase/lipase family protein [Enterovirga rhinocerotis]|uniref:Acyl-CoA thioesterase-1 n=1 Tax=Enterovirga rhinocerotis TaxID=1339210 RepID=A0A4R7C8M3_9HYPH|nr:GDSL-type esterase/lipase family protein [Enterovirga rhinocerotis]TDR94788.1 acyl-CoA thioesterase-1 [Enterovirga rhinocerotis]